MTPAERILLQRLPYAFAETSTDVRDTGPDATLIDTLQSDPDALYALIEHALLSDRALETAEAKVVALEDQLRKVSFLLWPGIVSAGSSGWSEPVMASQTPFDARSTAERSFAPRNAVAASANVVKLPAPPRPFSARPVGRATPAVTVDVYDNDENFSDLGFEDGLGGGY